jgi:hypothetical protein
LRNETTVAGAASGGQFSLNSSHLQDSFLHHVDQTAGRREEGQATQGPFNLKLELVLLKNVSEALL